VVSRTVGSGLALLLGACSSPPLATLAAPTPRAVLPDRPQVLVGQRHWLKYSPLDTQVTFGGAIVAGPSCDLPDHCPSFVANTTGIGTIDLERAGHRRHIDVLVVDTVDEIEMPRSVWVQPGWRRFGYRLWQGGRPVLGACTLVAEGELGPVLAFSAGSLAWFRPRRDEYERDAQWEGRIDLAAVRFGEGRVRCRVGSVEATTVVTVGP